MIGIRDKNGTLIKEGDNVEVTVNAWNGSIVVAKGKIMFRAQDASSWGCGWGVQDGRNFTFLSSISKGNTDIEVKEAVWGGSE